MTDKQTILLVQTLRRMAADLDADGHDAHARQALRRELIALAAQLEKERKPSERVETPSSRKECA